MSDREKQNSPFPHLPYADALRVCAITAVVALHTSAFVVLSFGTISRIQWWVGNLFDAAVRWCVPVFVMLSGLLLLDPRKEEELVPFFRKRVRRVLVPLIAWSAIYFAWSAFWHGNRLTPPYVIKKLVFGMPYFHLYFLFIIFGLYLITPPLRIYVRHASAENLKYTIVLSFLLGALFYFLQYWRGIRLIYGATLFLPYVGYYLAGHYLNLSDIKRKRIPILGLLFLAGVAVTAAGTGFLFTRYGTGTRSLYLYEYLSPPVILMSLSAFLLIKSMFPSGAAVKKNPSPLFRLLLTGSLGIYLFHPIVMDILKDKLGVTGLWVTPVIGIPVTTLIVLLLSAVIVLAMSKTPVLKHILGM